MIQWYCRDVATCPTFKMHWLIEYMEYCLACNGGFTYRVNIWHHGMFGRHKRLESAWTFESNFDSCGFQVLNGIFQGIHAVSSTQLFPCHDVRRFEVIQRWYCARNLVHHEVIKDHKGTSLSSLNAVVTQIWHSAQSHDTLFLGLHELGGCPSHHHMISSMCF